MQQRQKITQTDPEHDSQATIQNQQEPEELSRQKAHSHPLDHIRSGIGDRVSVAKHAAVIQRTGLFTPGQRRQRNQSLLELQRRYGNRFVQRVIAQDTIQRKKLQMKVSPAVLQRQEMEEEEPLQGKFESVQRQKPEEEEELQMKVSPAVLQRQEMEEEEPLQGKFESVQRQSPEEEDEVLQGKFTPNDTSAQFQGAKNRNGIPRPLKAGLETLSGMDLSGVRVHNNSSKPAQLNALAYTQGQDIHVGLGQEKHLPHEGWHAVQQMQGRVKPTMQAKGVSINDDAGLEREADVMGAKAFKEGEKAEVKTKHAPMSGAVDLTDVDVEKLKAHVAKLEVSGSQIPVVAEESQLKNHPQFQNLARRFLKTAPSIELDADKPIQMERDSNWWLFGTYNMVEVTGIPKKFIEHGDDKKADYNFYKHGHLAEKVKGSNSTRDSNFGIVISGSGGKWTYHWDDRKQAEWSKTVQDEVGGTAGGETDRKTVSMHNWAFRNIEASDWFDVVPGVLEVVPQEEFLLYGVDQKIPFLIPAKGTVNVSYSQIVSKSAGMTTDQSLGKSTTRTREITLGFSATLEKKDVYKVGSALGLSETNVSKVWKEVSNKVSRVNTQSSKDTAMTPITAEDKPEHWYVYPVWSVLPIRVKAYPHDSEAKVTGNKPTWFTVSHMMILQMKAVRADAEGEMKPGASPDPGLVAEEKRLEALKSGSVMKVGGHWVKIALERERRMLKDWDHQQNLTVDNKGGFHSELQRDYSKFNSFAHSDSNGQEVTSTGKWELGVSGELLGLGGKFGYSEAETTAANYGDSVAKSGGMSIVSSLTIKISVPGPSDPNTYVQITLVPMYTERIYKYAVYDTIKEQWGPWIKNRTRSREYALTPAIIRTVRPKGTPTIPMGPGELDPSEAQKKTLKR